MNELISVIVPIYKVEKYLSQCIESILDQTYKNLEIILVDDGSPDGCGKLCDEYAAKDNRILVIHKENGGLSAARNAGIDICKGEYISFIDSDDFVSPYFIEILYKGIKFNDSDISFVTHGVNFIDGNDSNVVFAKNENDYTIKEISKFDTLKSILYQKINGGAQWRLYKRAIFSEIRFPLGYLFEDFATVYKTIIEAERLSTINADIYAYRIRPDSNLRMDFSPEKMVSIIISQQLVSDISAYNKRLKKAAMSRAFAINYHVFLQVPFNDNVSRKKLWFEIRKYRKTVMLDLDPMLRIKNRVAALVSYLGMNNAWKIRRLIINKSKFN